MVTMAQRIEALRTEAGLARVPYEGAAGKAGLLFRRVPVLPPGGEQRPYPAGGLDE